MSCYFDSLSQFFHVNSNVLRQEICNYLAMNKPIMEDIETNDLLKILDEGYVERMRRSETWAGGIEISATCNLWGVTVVVHSNRAKPIVFQPMNKTSKYVINLFWTGNHYEPLLRRSSGGV